MGSIDNRLPGGFFGGGEFIMEWSVPSWPIVNSCRLARRNESNLYSLRIKKGWSFSRAAMSLKEMKWSEHDVTERRKNCVRSQERLENRSFRRKILPAIVDADGSNPAKHSVDPNTQPGPTYFAQVRQGLFFVVDIVVS